MLLSGDGIGINPRIWWLLSGLFFAIALAIPDAGAMMLGSVDHDPVSPWWPWLTGAFIGFIVAGVFCALVSFLLALGPYQPAWFLGLKRVVIAAAKKK